MNGRGGGAVREWGGGRERERERGRERDEKAVKELEQNTTLMQMAMTSGLADRPPECLNTADDLRGHSYLRSHWQRVYVLLTSVPFCPAPPPTASR